MRHFGGVGREGDGLGAGVALGVLFCVFRFGGGAVGVRVAPCAEEVVEAAGLEVGGVVLVHVHVDPLFDVIVGVVV